MSIIKLVSKSVSKLVEQGWEFAHRFSVRIAHFFQKNWANERIPSPVVEMIFYLKFFYFNVLFKGLDELRPQPPHHHNLGGGCSHHETCSSLVYVEYFNWTLTQNLIRKSAKIFI